MGSFGGFYKGEKKKTKKDKDKKGSTGFTTAPTLVLPEIVGKKKKDWE